MNPIVKSIPPVAPVHVVEDEEPFSALILQASETFVSAEVESGRPLGEVQKDAMIIILGFHHGDEFSVVHAVKVFHQPESRLRGRFARARRGFVTAEPALDKILPRTLEGLFVRSRGAGEES